MFWSQYEKWQNECKNELREFGYNPDDWEICENGDCHLIANRFIYIKECVTPW
ncbi:MAG TPA: hypothetical protein GX708_01860 [Gallicola sp.]|nr:hypothetical protein [Gallicola sp.]